LLIKETSSKMFIIYIYVACKFLYHAINKMNANNMFLISGPKYRNIS
jgi:hypothetical protein